MTERGHCVDSVVDDLACCGHGGMQIVGMKLKTLSSPSPSAVSEALTNRLVSSSKLEVVGIKDRRFSWLRIGFINFTKYSFRSRTYEASSHLSAPKIHFKSAARGRCT